MENPFKQIFRFNDGAGFLNRPLNYWLESAYQVEEALEGFDLAHLSAVFPSVDATPKELSRAVMGFDNKDKELAAVDVLDKSLDAIVYAVGTAYKLGLGPNELTRALNIVMQHNLQKLKDPEYDDEGKLLKADDFEGPEKQLQQLIDSVKGV